MGKFRPTLDNTIGRHARKAAVIIGERGWTQGREEDAFTGQVCLVGAFRRAISPVPKTQQHQLRSVFSTRFGRWMTEHYPDAASSVHACAGAPSWNDLVFKTKEETLAWLNKFADDLDPQR